ncbi:NUDIX domain-containing protein [Nesterenkonia cremea]|uniref:NTP pyrophosphohydrolase n=1 Tax=Nesterenkonia cremea TaxID=1882340 RepID=A0A917ALN9_9MICC|nr:NUDIX hydrolase [Nesterenkonia cremea]GGE60836.1 NTP pyrophosphohydrolase [Nesterenkonia cremea]
MSIQDSPADLPVQSSEKVLTTPIFDAVKDSFTFGERGETLRRVYLKHLSAVAVLAVDEQDRVLLINQYRHPVRMKLWEIPAGLLDVDGEPMLEGAQRELVEEADLQAQTWSTLLDFYTTPGANNEAIRIYLAEGLTEVPEAERHTREAEEAEITTAWLPLAEAVQAVLSGRIHNPSAANGILALHAVRTGAGELREARAPWTDHPRAAEIRP